MPGRRIVKLRGQTDQFRYLGNQWPNQREQETTRWASCAVRDSIKLPRNFPSVFPGSGIYIGHGFEIATVVFASLVFAPLTAAGLVTGYVTTGLGAIAATVTTGALGNAGLFLTGALATLGITNPYIQGPQMTNFNKPCDLNAGNF